MINDIVFLDIEPIARSIRNDIGLDFDNPDTISDFRTKRYSELLHKFITNIPDGFGLIVNRGKSCEKVIEN
jgi:hypothetical protein